MARVPISAVEELMAQKPDATLEAALEVFEVFASGSLTDEVVLARLLIQVLSSKTS